MIFSSYLKILLPAALLGVFALANADDSRGSLSPCADLGKFDRLPADACILRDDTVRYLTERLQREWVELDSDFEGKRYYVNFASGSNPFMTAKPMRLFLRGDRPILNGGAATRIETIDLDCSRSEAKVSAIAHHDGDGKLLGEQRVIRSQPELLKLSYRSPLSEVCRRDYIFRLAENGEAYLQAVKRYARESVRASLPDRDIPLPSGGATKKTP